MPKIVELDPGKLGLQPTETGVEAAASAGRRLGAFYNQVGEAQQRYGERGAQEISSTIRDAGQVAVDYEDHREISHGAATFATLTDNLTNQWNDVAKNADPNDPSVAAKFRETVLEPSLEKFRDSFNTEKSQNWAETHIDQLRNHMFEKTASDMATLAGQAAKVNTAQTINTLSNTAFNDPTSLGFALKSFDTSVEGIVGSSPNLKGAAAAAIRSEISEKGREQIVKSAAIGYIQKNAQVPPWATDPQYSKYINGTELQMFQKAAKAQAKADFLADKQVEAYQRQQADNAVRIQANKVFDDNVKYDDATGRVVINPNLFKQAIALPSQHADAPSASDHARALLNWGEAQQRSHAEPIVSDPFVKSDLLSRIGDPNRPTTEMQILDWAARDKLSSRDTTLFREMVHSMGSELSKDPVVHASIQGARERVGVGLMSNGHERYAGFLQSFWPEYLKQKNEGTLKSNALDFKDETSLIRQSLKQWEPTPQERLRAEVMKRMQSVGGTENTPAEPPKATPALPPKDKLEDGKVYDTARGQLKWDAKHGTFVTP